MSLDPFQQVFTLSYVSNIVNNSTGTQEDLQKELQAKLPSLFPGTGWELVWGPVVLKHLDPDDITTGPDNSWYVAHHPSFVFEDGSVHPTYVIAIAGTPANSQHAWELQNLAVDSVANFNDWVTNGITNPPEVATNIVAGRPYIATGTVNAVHFLLNTAPPAGAPSAGKKLIDFVAHVGQSDSAKIITAGHSLGGALSPSLALALVSSGTTFASSTLTYPSAGPSPGNTAFRDLFEKTLPAIRKRGGNSYQAWNLNLINRLDMVPQAWSTRADMSPEQNLNNIPTLYGKPAIEEVSGLTLLLALHAGKSLVFYMPLPSQSFTGPPPPTPAPTDVGEFLSIALPQHMEAYLDLVGIEIPENFALSGHGVTPKPKEARRYNHPLIAGFEWARKHPKEAEKEIEKGRKEKEGKKISQLS